jgi:hypothetical protein
MITPTLHCKMNSICEFSDTTDYLGSGSNDLRKKLPNFDVSFPVFGMFYLGTSCASKKMVNQVNGLCSPCQNCVVAHTLPQA